MKKEERRSNNRSNMGERFGHETGRHGSVRSKNQIDVSLRTRCVVLRQSWKSEGTFPSTPALLSWNQLHKDHFLGYETGRCGSVCAETRPKWILRARRFCLNPSRSQKGPTSRQNYSSTPDLPPWRPLCSSGPSA